MNKFRMDTIIDVHDVDYNGVARASSLMHYMQTAAQTQLTLSGRSYEALQSDHRTFVVSKMKMEFYAPLHTYDKIEAETFPCNSTGFSFLRCYSLNKNGVPVARAISVWALIDTQKHSLVKVSDFNLGLDTFEPIDMSLTRLSLPKDLADVGTYRIRYSDVDQNRHMNNTAYPDMYANFLPMQHRRIDSVTISYINEAPMGDELRVMLAERDGIYYIRTLRRDGKVNSEAEIHLTDID